MIVKNVVLIGATGSIGQNTLRVIEAHSDRLRLIAVANRSRCAELDEIGERFGVQHRVCCSRDGEKALCELATLPEADIVVMAAGGTVCLAPTLAAIEAGKTIALASKEVLVMAGAFVMEAARRKGVPILPVDSEHNAIFQCLDGRPGGLKRVILTASGGPFRDATLEEMRRATPKEALCHPNWSMGPKITIDSASMANKGLEMIEARWLFDVTPAQVDVVIHPQSIIHSMVEFDDGSMLAQLAPPSMTFAIQHALLYPERCPGVDAPLDLTKALNFSFTPPDPVKFRTLALARQAMEASGSAPALYNAANEVAVEAFVRKQIPFLAIATVIEQTLSTVPIVQPASLDELIQADAQARAAAAQAVTQIR